jgi:transcriptional regulator with XRE-family HTH domain
MNSLLRALVPPGKADRHQWWRCVLRASIARQIRQLRIDRQMTQERFASLLGTTQPRIAFLENEQAETFPTVKTLQHIAEICDCALIVKFEDWDISLDEIVEWMVPPSFIEGTVP